MSLGRVEGMGRRRGRILGFWYLISRHRIWRYHLYDEKEYSQDGIVIISKLKLKLYTPAKKTEGNRKLGVNLTNDHHSHSCHPSIIDAG